MVHHARRALLLGLILMLAAIPLPSRAQSERPITLMVAYPPGGPSDAAARMLAEGLSKRINRPVVVENRPGADGIIAMQALARAPADGTVLGFAAVSPLALTPHVQKLPFSADAIVPVVPVMYAPAVMIATPALQAGSVSAVVEMAKRKPGSIRAGVAGTLSMGTLAMEQLQETSGAEFTIVPYKGGGQLVTDALSGQFEILYINVANPLLQSIADGKLKALAIAAPERLAALPDVPTLAEEGYKSASRASVFGIYAPAGVPAEVLQSLNAQINDVIAQPAFKARLADMGSIVTGGSAAQFADRIRQESTANAEIIKKAGLAPR